MSGLVVGLIVLLLVVVLAVFCVVAFVHWKRQNYRFVSNRMYLFEYVMKLTYFNQRTKNSHGFQTDHFCCYNLVVCFL